METKKENLGKSKVKLTIKVSSPEMREFFSKAYNKLAPSVEVKGFRRGTAPRSLTISAMGESRLNSEIVDMALNETYSKALKEENIVPVSQPKVNIKMLKDLTVETAEFEYEAEVDILPEIKMGDYKKLKVTPLTKEDKELEVKEAEVEQVVSHLLRQKATFKDIERPLKDGDRAEINFEGFDKGVKLENFTSKNYPVILGSKVLLPDFEKNIVGAKKGESKEFTNEVPEVPTQEKSGKDKKNRKVDFKVEILTTQEVILPKLDDTFAKDFGKDTLAELKKAITDDIAKEKAQALKKKTENNLLDSLLKITELEVPESLVEQELDRQINDISSRLAMNGHTLEKYLENIKQDLATFRSNLKPQAERTIKIGLALGEVAKREIADKKIDAKEKDLGNVAISKLLEYNKV